MKPFENTQRILKNAISSIDETEFGSLETSCYETLTSGGKIIVTGLGKNVPICEKFVGTLTSMGISAAFMHTNSAVHGDLGLVREEDMVIVLTKSGETAESVYLVQLLEQKKCKIWLISFHQDSILANKVQHKLIINLEHEGDSWDILPNHSTTLNLIVLQELAMNLIKKLEVPLSILQENHPGGAIGEKLQEKLS